MRRNRRNNRMGKYSVPFLLSSGAMKPIAASLFAGVFLASCMSTDTQFASLAPAAPSITTATVPFDPNNPTDLANAEAATLDPTAQTDPENQPTEQIVTALAPQPAERELTPPPAQTLANGISPDNSLNRDGQIYIANNSLGLRAPDSEPQLSPNATSFSHIRANGGRLFTQLFKRGPDSAASQSNQNSNVQLASVAQPAQKPAQKSVIAIEPRHVTDADKNVVIKTKKKNFFTTLFGKIAGTDEDGEADKRVEVASLGSFARVSPNGIRTQTDKVSVKCFKPKLVKMIKKIERHYKRPVVVTSGYRSPKHNKRIGGATGSRHTTCEAADVQVQGITKWELAKYVRTLPGRGGVGTYCHTKSVHIDIGTVRDWNWRCRRKK